jgi:group I intron endonuclease
MKDKEQIQGIIYKVINTETNETYIGATTKSINERKIDHIQKSENGKGYKFHNAISTYGANAFLWEQVDTAGTNNELASKEIKYISEYDALGKGYNLSKGGNFKKTVFQYNLDGTPVNSFGDLTSAAVAVNATKKSISKACWNVNHTLKGYLWSYDNKEKFITDSDNRKKEVLQYNLNGNLLAQYISVAEASRKSGLSKTCISRCCRKEREQSRGFLWRYS